MSRMPPPAPAVETLRALLALSADLATQVDVSLLLERMLDSLMQVFRAERGFVLLADARTGELSPALSRGGDAGAGGVSSTVARRVAELRTPLLITDAELADLKAATRSLAQSEVRSIICTPLVKDEQLLGVLYLDSRALQRPYGREDLALLETTARGAAGLIATALEADQLRRDVRIFRALHHGDAQAAFAQIIGRSRALTAVLKQARAVASQEVTALILGPSGTGKELLAKAIHGASRRRERPFVAVNCAALAPDVIESELFGHEKGAFTGAGERRIGRFELADRGTLFLDEIGELKPDVQVKLLRVLEARQIERVGSSKPVDIDVRLVAATNVDLETAVKRGAFREDLYYRLNVIALRLPALAERDDDVPLLVEHFVREFNARVGRTLRGVEPAAMEALVRYRWPGNIRELRNVIERAFVLEASDRLTVDSLPHDLVHGARGGATAPAAGASPFAGYPPQLEAARGVFERAFILEALKRHGFNVTAAAQAMDVPRNTLYRRMEALGIRPAEVARGAPRDGESS